MKRLMSFVAAAVLLPAAVSAADGRCTLPGELIVEDASGDDQLAPTGQGFVDIHSLHMAEPADSSALVITFKMADLAFLPPNTLWALRFVTDVLAPGTAEYFVAMLTDPAGTAKFVHGTAAPADGSGGVAALLFTPAGALEAASNFNADGTIALVLDKSKVGGLQPGGFIYGMIPITHRITPTDGARPFAYGFRSAGGVVLPYDDAGDGLYEIVGNDSCSEDKSAVLGVGALSPAALLLLLLVPALRHARVRVPRPSF